MKSILFILFFCKVVCCAQPIVLDGIYVDSLVQNVKYAEANLLKVQDKYALIAALLEYEGNVDINPTYPVNFTPLSNPEMHSAAHSEPTQTTNQAVALYLIESILNDKFLFLKIKTTYISCFCEEKNFPIYSVIPEHYFSSKERFFKTKNKNLNHINNIYKIYKKWFKKIKKTKLPFVEAIQKFASPLPTQHYSWTGDFRTK